MNAKQSFWRGVRAELPILLGVTPFGLIYGALAIQAGLGKLAAQAMSSILFAGSAQFIAVQLVSVGASSALILAVIFVVNLRHALYSASLAPYMRSLSLPWKMLLAYLLTDEAYAVTITHYQQEDEQTYHHWYFFGAGITLWTDWQISTALGIFIGASLPANFPLGFALPLTFIALLVPGLRTRPSIAAALVGGIAGVVFFNLPYKLGLMIAALLGILTGFWMEGKQN